MGFGTGFKQRRMEGNIMVISDLLCDLYDIKRQAKFHNFGLLPKDNEGTETTINDCLDHLIEQLESVEIGENEE